MEPVTLQRQTSVSRIVVIEQVIEVADGECEEYGRAEPDKRTVWLDPRQCSRDYLDTLVHECIHLMVADLYCECGRHQADWPEEKVAEWERLIGDAVWSQGYRRVEP